VPDTPFFMRPPYGVSHFLKRVDGLAAPLAGLAAVCAKNESAHRVAFDALKKLTLFVS